jgi:hypothetical protein
MSQPAPVTAPIGQIGDISKLITPIFDAARAHAGDLQHLGLVLLSVAVLLEIFNAFIHFWVKGGASEMMSKIVRLIIVTSIPFALLTSWPTLPNTIIDFFVHDVSGKFISSQGGALAAIANAMTQVNNAAATVLNFHDQAHAVSAWHVGDKIVAALTGLVVYIVLFIPVLLLSLAMLFALYGPMLMLALGIIFGPIMVAWLPWEPMSNLATKWLSYMLTMGLSFAIGIAMASMMIDALLSFAAEVHAQNNSTDMAMAALAGLIPMIGGIAFIGYMMLKVEHIAAAMIGGPSVGGGAGFFGMATGMAMRGMGGKKSGGDKPAKIDSSSASPPSGSNTPSGNTPSGGSTAQLSTGAAQAAGMPAPSSSGGASGAMSSGSPGKYQPLSRPAGAPAVTPASASSGNKLASATPNEGSGEASASESSEPPAQASFSQKMAQGAKAVAGSGPGKLAAFGTAAVVGGPLAAAAVGAYAVSPGVRKGVSAVGRSLGGAASATGSAVKGAFSKPQGAPSSSGGATAAQPKGGNTSK